MLWNVNGISSTKVIAIEGDDTELRTGTIIELDETDWGGKVSSYLVSNVHHNDRTIDVVPYRKRIMKAYPSSNSKV